ncbi:MAG TPA: hypothetical protein VFB33_00400 [Candidatus Binataceae bacterium]|nr:hypothetical protein [Candidatus Binataceae bacterium]
MKLCSAAALALAAWYLVAPPFTSDGVNSSLPLAQWQQMAAFGTTAECEAYAASLKKYSAERASQNKDPRYQDMLKYAAQSIAGARCVAGNDPQLKK